MNSKWMRVGPDCQILHSNENEKATATTTNEPRSSIPDQPKQSRREQTSMETFREIKNDSRNPPLTLQRYKFQGAQGS